ncbi:hypothetical protein CC78DRAFT_581870 [Lojkania enalia]|uniref:Uncharacterized protein n=1 Tax=Lojkania enalia TaxID=147567 RepID=A0A9P4K6R5_9PLEO|nr:hypothetical protein CC78DRAFT_581870 [Didymosphaeria enalia]
MTEPATTTTPRQTQTSEPQFKNPKDKKCPFCGQRFTSSSLGRHLDLYIRAKNPKPADGIHNVDEIKKIRSNITRRQAKASAIKKESTTPASSKKQSISRETDASPPLVQSPTGTEDGPAVPKPRQQFNDVSWQPSGAPNDPPQRALGTKTPEVRRDVSRHIQKTELDQRHRLSEEAETATAIEMALRELLKGVREANAKASGVGLFDFDPYTLSFPSLCLHILPAPPTLFSPTPFSTSESWSIHPPGQKQLDSLNRQLRERLLAQQRQRQINQLYPPNARSNSSSIAGSPLPTPPLFDPDPQRLFGHVADAYSHWTSLTDDQRQETWQLEILRAHARANDMRRETEISLENARREIEYLKANRWSSGAPDLSPIVFNICSETSKELGKRGLDFRNWDYDRLIDKWKTIVRDNKNATNGMAAQKPLPSAATRSCSMVSLPTAPFAMVSTGPDTKMQSTFPEPPTTNGAEPSSDQVDAEGEDDDADADIDAEAASDGDSFHNQPHVLPLQPTPIHPSQMQMHASIQAQVQAHAQAQAQAQAHAHAQAQVQAQAQAQAQAWARQHMNQSRNTHHHQHQHQHPHQHPQLSPHPSHMGSATNSRRTSQVLMDAHSMNTGGMLPMDGIENHQDQFLRMGMGLADQFVGSTGDGV